MGGKYSLWPPPSSKQSFIAILSGSVSWYQSYAVRRARPCVRVKPQAESYRVGPSFPTATVAMAMQMERAFCFVN